MLKFFAQIGPVVAWLQIVAAPLLLSCAIGAFLYFNNPNQTNLILAIAIAIVGLIVGIMWANKIQKSKGSLWFMSRVNASPDLDHVANDKQK